MTIDEFMADIAPKMRPGWVAMDKNENWLWYISKPELQEYEWYPKNLCYTSLECFNISPVDDWTQSLMETGSHE